MSLMYKISYDEEERGRQGDRRESEQRQMGSSKGDHRDKSNKITSI